MSASCPRSAVTACMLFARRSSAVISPAPTGIPLHVAGWQHQGHRRWRSRQQRDAGPWPRPPPSPLLSRRFLQISPERADSDSPFDTQACRSLTRQYPCIGNSLARRLYADVRYTDTKIMGNLRRPRARPSTPAASLRRPRRRHRATPTASATPSWATPRCVAGLCTACSCLVWI